MQLRLLKSKKIFTIWLIFLFISAQGCTSARPPLPTLPEKDWLAPEKEEQTTESKKFAIYSPDKTLGMDDLVWLAVQQSPVISRGRINLEISEISKTDAKWRYLPEMHLSYRISNNLTKYNEGTRYAGDDYGNTTYELTFTGSYNNPVSTYFSVQAQDELLKTAIITQRKAIAEIIFKIASSLLQMNMLEESIAILEKQIALSDRKMESASIRDALTNSASLAGTANEYNQSSLELHLREIKMQLTVERTILKQLVGLDLKQALKVDAKSVYALLADFDPARDDWKRCWEDTEERYLARQQVKLEQANIYLAWASYLPNINLYINESPGKGQSQAADARSDQFLHVALDFPLLDWGHRWRDADKASLRRRQSRLDEVQRARDYEQEWEIKGQRLQLAQAKAERWKQTSKNIAARSEAMQIAFDRGSASFDMLADQKQRELDAEIAAVRADCEAAQTKLAWIHFASGLSRHYMGSAGYGKAEK